MKYKITDYDLNSCAYCDYCKVIERSYQQGRADAIEEFMSSVIDGYTVIEWNGKSYIIQLKEQMDDRL